MKKNKIAILLSCYNRKQTTLQCLHHLLLLNEGVDIYLVDDNSTDGTFEAIALQFPTVNTIKGAGNLFWNRGMHLAWHNASKFDYEYYIWMNDDVILYNDAFDELFSCSALANNSAIISGIIEQAETKTTLYGGSARDGLIQPNGKLNAITNMNGNVVLIPRSVFQVLGNLDLVFHHDLGDVDYGLRAQQAGIGVFTTRKAIASGEKNNYCRVRKWNSNIMDRFKKLYSPLGNHPFINFYFRKKHYGWLNAINYFVYIHLINILTDRIIILFFGYKYTDNYHK